MSRKRSSKPPASGTPTSLQSRQRGTWNGKLPQPADDAFVPWARNRPELADVTDALAVHLLMATPEWRSIVLPELASIDQERLPKPGYRFDWTSAELESVALYARAAGQRTMKNTLASLSADAARGERIRLGFTRSHTYSADGAERFVNAIPSASSLCRHFERFAYERRRELYLQVADALRTRLLAVPEMQQATLILNLDGTAVETRYSSDDKTARNRTNSSSHRGPATAPDAGKRNTPAHGYQEGWQWLPVVAANAVPIAGLFLLPLGDEKAACLPYIWEFREQVLPQLPAAVRVATCDGAFFPDPIREAWRSAGVVENIHHVSHANSERAETYRRKVIDIKDATEPWTEYWTLDGLMQPRCRCGHGRPEKVIDVDAQGRAVVRMRLRCRNPNGPSCPNGLLTSGEWKRVDRRDKGYTSESTQRVRRVGRGEQPNLEIGNPLTYDDANAREYGKDRFGNNEGFFGAFSQRFGLLDGKNYFRSGREAEAELGVALCLIYMLSLRYYETTGASPVANAPGVTSTAVAPSGSIPATTATVAQSLPAGVAPAGASAVTAAGHLVTASSTLPPRGGTTRGLPAGTHGSALRSRPKVRQESAHRNLRQALHVVRTQVDAATAGPTGPAGPNGGGFQALFGARRGTAGGAAA